MLVPSEPLLAILDVPVVDPTQSHHWLTAVPFAVQVKVSEEPDRVESGTGLVISGSLPPPPLPVKAVYWKSTYCQEPVLYQRRT